MSQENLRRNAAIIAALAALLIIATRTVTTVAEMQREERQSEQSLLGRADPIGERVTVNGNSPRHANASPWQTRSFSAASKQVVDRLRSGSAVALSVAGLPSQRFRFRPTRVTTDEFWFSDGANNEIPMDFRAFHGRAFEGADSRGTRVSAAVVADAVVYYLRHEEREYLIHQNPATQEVYAETLLRLAGHDGLSVCTSHPNGLAGLTVPESADNEIVRVSASVEFEDDGALEPPIAGARVDHPHFRLGPEYDASLRDLQMIWISDQTQTGSSSQLPSKAAMFLTYAAEMADTYERQLGLRPILQELILIPNDAGVPAPIRISPPEDLASGEQLDDVSPWMTANRPQGTYQWGHAAFWTLVGGEAGGTVGWSYVGGYGRPRFGCSVNEANFGVRVLLHEFGHNVGADHSSGGIMNASVPANDENFYRQRDNGDIITAAQQIYVTMTGGNPANPTAPLANSYGPADLRSAVELPFARDDLMAAPLDTPLSFNPLTNDDASVLFGAVNVLSLVEVGAVFPRGAGSAEVSGNQIIFTPSSGYTGEVWFSYTIRGDVGNGGAGWLHAADVIITVGGDNTEPSLTPATDLQADQYFTDFTSPFRFNPLLNDIGTGTLAPGDIDVVSWPDDSTSEPYSGQSLYLVGASVLQGPGSIALETRDMIDDGAATLGNNGYIIYSPTGAETDDVIIEYSVRDANDQQFTSTATISLDPNPPPPEPIPPAAIVIRGQAESADTGGNDPSHTISNFTVSEHSDRKLILAVSWEQANASVGATWKGNEVFTTAVNSAGGRNAAILYLDHPSVGTGNLVITFGDNTASRASVLSLSGGAEGVETMTTTSGPSGQIETVANDSLVVGVYTSNSNLGNPSITSPFATDLHNGGSGSSGGSAGYQIESGINTYSYTWTGTNLSADNHALATFRPYVSYLQWADGNQLGNEFEIDKDPDGDGVVNGIEAFWGTDPGAFAQGFSSITSNGLISSLNHPANGAIPDDLNHAYEWSPDLQNWYETDGIDGPSAPGSATVTASPSTQNSVTTVTFTASSEMPFVFFRIRVFTN